MASHVLYMSDSGYAKAAKDATGLGLDTSIIEWYLPSALDGEAGNKEHATGARKRLQAFASDEVRAMVRWIYAGDYELLRFYGIDHSK